MGWLDSPAVSIRKQLPDRFHSDLNAVENFARHTLDSEPEHISKYQLGIVLALWVKAAEVSDEFSLSPKISKRIQDIYASCVKTIRGDSFQAFRVLETLSEQGGTFSVPPELYRRLGMNVVGVA